MIFNAQTVSVFCPRMNDFSAIEKAVGNVSLATEDGPSNYQEAGGASSPETVLALKAMVDSLMSDNKELNKRLSTIEAKVTSMDAGFNRLLGDSSVELPDEGTTRNRDMKPATDQGTTA
ncbi:hypothetical protein NUU61_003332 [Penicillium alfredii]|uniref:Uncharacterized protein n=1 Tax=Penicillium alfredii TaxID=1506179 RepID=A0A9W9FT90_9EURO|nr:uncharacterized protein NUU61_003332 [Penicillium alfredii]KAJ5105985.1 hypothetical protein NUU61_003332 [Penicillium alfredii]